MADGVICVDFGSSFTKVSVRRGRRTNSEIVVSAEHTLPAGTDTSADLRICVPSAVVVDTTTSTPQYSFGLRTINRRSSDTIIVRRNWKKDLFSATGTSPVVAPPKPRKMTRLESLIHSPAFVQLAEHYRISKNELTSLQWLVINATSLTLPIYNTPPSEGPVDYTFPIAVEFFRWLRGVVLAAASGQGGQDAIARYPVRITVPAFAPEDQLAQHPGCVRLREALQLAKWELHSEMPFVSEPYANAVGVLTQGSNCTRVADMFRHGLLITALRDPKAHDIYRVTVIDVGSYTIDFACLTMNSHGHVVQLSEIEFESVTHSIELAMSDLDEVVLAALEPENQAYFRDEASPAEWADLRSSLYSLKQPYSSPVGDVGTPTEMPRIEAAITEFQTRLRTETAKFFDSVPDVSFKELVLTGGGSTVPAIQEALIGAAEAGRQRYRKVHLPTVAEGATQRETTNLQIVTPLEPKLTRGATALGGTSSYFDLIT
jgi:hypothetical protein